MGGLGFPELIVILVIVLLIFGAGKLPQVGDALGKAIRNFRGSSTPDPNPIEVSKKKEIASVAKDDVEDAEVSAPAKVAADKKSK